MTRKKKDAIGTPGGERPGDDRLSRRLKAAKDALERIRSGQAPTPEELAAAPRLDFWCIVFDNAFPVFHGVVTGHPHLADGAMIGTSPILWISEDRTAARTVSRWYRLGVRLGEAIGPRS